MSSALFSFFSAESASSPSFPSRFVARVQPVNEITRSNLWHQIPNENMIIAANAECRVRRTAVSRDRRRRTSRREGEGGTMILFFASPIALFEPFGILITEQRAQPRKHDQGLSNLHLPQRLCVFAGCCKRYTFCCIIDIN